VKLIKQEAHIENCMPGREILQVLERAARTCYKSDRTYIDADRVKFLKMLLKRGHLSVFEHCSLSMRYITSRSVTHELVRHRLASYSQESQRYVAYKYDVLFIEPVDFDKYSPEGRQEFVDALESAEEHYHKLLTCWNCLPQQAREVLPNATATEIVMTANLREWLHILKLRTSKKAHPQIRDLMLKTQEIFVSILPDLFRDIHYGNS